ncbi:outer membrane lipoprotein-sorting protein [Pseudoalteromonas luteoviolacea]|uniref:outer membrane lipoprotein-sorting protein n=1 Tax=Pseudoalteromonas luteoviolacea TaxID=43657 RepID=UPI001152A71C|nr:outer membrane lipoprotein-sorting protein [Pseudoalteromonas luteoviolacea]TQF66175.1 outer membrane lipoprotein-sorting protein [Pseudoalteromonas luteoviolacea]
MATLSYKKVVLTKTALFLAFSSALFTPYASSLTAEQKGLEIAEKVENLDSGWGNAAVSARMILRNSQGEESYRDFRINLLEVEGDGDKGLIIFDSPRDIKGTGLLSYTHALVADEQWLYLPSLKRVKRINSNNKSGPFIGSEFSYEDITSFEVEKFRYKYIRDEEIFGRDAFVQEVYPNYKHSGYKKIVSWIDKERYIPLKNVYYDRKNQLLKTQTFSDYKQYKDQFWRASTQVMENHNSGKVTRIEWSDYKFQIGLTKRNFNISTLKRIK